MAKLGSSNHLKLEHFIKHNYFAQRTYSIVMGSLLKLWGSFLKTDAKMVLMNGHGYKYNDSPRAIYQKMLEMGLDTQFDIVWALKDPDEIDIPGRVKKIKIDTIEYFKTALKAKYWISCVNIERGLRFKKREQIYLNTWHGGAINACGNAASDRHDYHWGYINYFCAVGKLDEINYGRDMELNPASFLESGYPRNDVLSHITPTLKRTTREKLGLDPYKKVILYAPTWRDSKDGGLSYTIAPPIDWIKWEKELGNEYIVLLRTHPYTTKLMNVTFNEFVFDFTAYPEINDLFIVADLLISDYSGVLLDYSITERPMICFGYDFEEYVKDRGQFYYDLEKEMPSGILRTEDEVIHAIKCINYEQECLKTRLFKNNHCEFEKGDATIKCINAVFGSDYQRMLKNEEVVVRS